MDVVALIILSTVSLKVVRFDPEPKLESAVNCWNPCDGFIVFEVGLIDGLRTQSR